LLKYSVNDAKPVPVSGNLLSHNRWDPIGKAFMAADLYLGKRILRDPTIVQSALLARVNRTYAFHAIQRQAQRAEIEAGLIPLVPPVTAKPVLLTDDMIPDSELTDIVRKAGVARILDVAAQLEAAE
jgi:hypothetical protein